MSECEKQVHRKQEKKGQLWSKRKQCRNTEVKSERPRDKHNQPSLLWASACQNDMIPLPFILKIHKQIPFQTAGNFIHSLFLFKGYYYWILSNTIYFYASKSYWLFCHLYNNKKNVWFPWQPNYIDYSTN